ncbi:GNAT family N-acetyltransferase [Rhizobium sp. RAF56]|uniref:GNAT family N-acetyltransferase n=1 Tax=Rhizobium sp. RAF56 TaxID=3233062 RepID=UPI003F9E52D9
MNFEPLDPNRHDRQSFDCGVDALNIYLQRFANQDVRRGLTRTYVLADKMHIVGYYTLSAHSVLRDDLPEEVNARAYRELPFLLLGRLAVDLADRGRGYGDVLIVDAFRRTRLVAQQVGIMGMIVDAKDDRAAQFYERFGFQRLSGTVGRLVLPLNAMDSLID